MRILVFFLQLNCILFLNLTALAQPVKEWIQVVVTPDRDSWTYQTGARPEFRVAVVRNNMPLSNLAVSFGYGPELMKAVNSATQVIKHGSITVKSSTMGKPG